MSSSAVVIPRIRVFDGSPGEVRNARRFVGQAIGECPAAGYVVLLASELATNAIRHTASGAGGTFSVSVLAEDNWVRVEVHDLGSATAPAVIHSGLPRESGAGLGLVEAIADRWGFRGGQHGRVVWFEIGCGQPGIRNRNLAMSSYQCTCGFGTGDANDFDDHLRVAFAADSDTGIDGHEHYELADVAARFAGCSLPAYGCACGFATDDAAAFDDHLLGVFITPDSIGVDGRMHVLAGFTASRT